MMDTNLCKSFLNEKHISTLPLDEHTKEAIIVLKKVEQIVENHNLDSLERLQHDPAWGFLHTMYERAYEYTSAAVSLFAIGQIASAEALSCTAVETSINLYYASLGDSVSKVLSYFKYYVQTERKQNKTWLDSVEKGTIPEGAKQHH